MRTLTSLVDAIADAMAAIAVLDERGPSPDAFTFARRFGPPGSLDAVAADAVGASP